MSGILFVSLHSQRQLVLHACHAGYTICPKGSVEKFMKQPVVGIGDVIIVNIRTREVILGLDADCVQFAVQVLFLGRISHRPDE